MTRSWQISRRAMLRGLGAAIALPHLDAMAAPAGRPLRLMLIHIPNGWPYDHGYKDHGPYLHGLEALAAVRGDVTLIHGMGSGARSAHGKRKDQVASDGHGNGAVTVMSAQVPAAQGHKDWGIPKTMDQVIASEVFGRWAFPSLGVNVQPYGTIDTWHQPIYTRTIFWKGPGDPVRLYSDPRELFDLMFGGVDPALRPETQERRRQEKRSVLDFTREDASALRARLGGDDRQRLEQYLTSLRAVEAQIGALPAGAATCRGVAPPGELGTAMDSYPQRYEIIQSLAVKAFECDLTRVFQFMVGHEVNRPGYVPGVDPSRTWHTYSHDDYGITRRIVGWHLEQYRALIERMRATALPDGTTLLDESLLAFYSGCGDSSSHEAHNHQVFLAGRGGGRYRTGLCENVGGDIGDVWLTIMRDFGVQRPAFGHGTRIVESIRT